MKSKSMFTTFRHRFTPLVVAATLFSGLLALGCRAQGVAALRDDLRKTLIGSHATAILNAQKTSEMTVGEVIQERVRFTSEPGQDVFVLVHRPKAEGRYPAVIVQHFLGGTKDYPAFSFLYQTMAQRGFVVVAIDGRFRGERQNGTSLEAAMIAALKGGKGNPFLYDTAFDLIRLIDYLQTRPDVDPEKIGMTGFSEGGILTWLTSAADERIRVAVPIIGVTNFGETLSNADLPNAQLRIKLFEPVFKEYAKDLGENEINSKVLKSAWNRLVPGMLDRFDAANVIPQIAPRPLLILSHELDELFPIEGAKQVYNRVRSRYQEVNAVDRVDFRIAPGLTHAPTNVFQLLAEVNAMLDWMDRWLKRPAA